MSENHSTPDSTSTERLPEPVAQSVAQSDAQTAAQADSSARRPRKRSLLIGAGATLAGLVLVGGGIAAGAALAQDDDDDRDDSGQTSQIDDGTASGDRAGDDGDDSATGPASAGPAAAGTTSAHELSEIIDAAAAVAQGDAVSIEAERGGAWDVTFRTSEGETEVRVSADGTARVTDTDAADADDAAPRGVLDRATISALVDAALAAQAGTIVELDVDEDAASPYDVSVLTADSRTIDIDLDAQRKVVSTSADD